MPAFINKYMPAPNNYLVGDGLNTAGFAFNAPTRGDVSRYVLRLDHQLLNSTRIAFNLSKEWINTVFAPIAYPTEPPSISTPNSQAIYSLTVTTVIRANLINEVLVGVNRPRQPEDTPIGTHLCTFGHLSESANRWRSLSASLHVEHP